MSKFYLGVDVGATKTHAVIVDERGSAVGFGKSGPGNHEVVGYDGLTHAIKEAVDNALYQGGVAPALIHGAGFGVAGYDWLSERQPTLQSIAALGLTCKLEAVNDTLLGMIAGSTDGWGLAVVSGTGCNCRGWDKDRKNTGLVTGNGGQFGEAAGADDLVYRAVQLVAFDWTQRGPHTRLSQAFVKYLNARDLTDLLEGLANHRYVLDGSAAPIVFQIAETGDAVARDLVRWAGIELAELAKAVIRQIKLQNASFEVVLIGSMFNAGYMLTEPMRLSIQSLAPGARLVRFEDPPVTGAAILALEQGGVIISPEIHQAVAATTRKMVDAV